MEDDVLSDVVPSNIVSRQVWFSSSFTGNQPYPHRRREGERRRRERIRRGRGRDGGGRIAERRREGAYSQPCYPLGGWTPSSRIVFGASPGLTLAHTTIFDWGAAKGRVIWAKGSGVLVVLLLTTISRLQDGPPSPSKLAKMQASEERQRKKQKRKADEGQLAARRQEMDKAKVSRVPDDCASALRHGHALPPLERHSGTCAILWTEANAAFMRRHVLRGVAVLA